MTNREMLNDLLRQLFDETIAAAGDAKTHAEKREIFNASVGAFLMALPKNEKDG